MKFNEEEVESLKKVDATRETREAPEYKYAGAEQKPDTMIDRIVEKRRDIMVKFKSMNEILNKYGAWFDGYGNLCVSTYGQPGPTHLAPSYFHYLGKTIEMKSHHSFPDWCIEQQWSDLFEQNMALRAIANGNMDADRMREIAKKACIAP